MDARRPMACPLCSAKVKPVEGGSHLDALDRHFAHECTARLAE